MPAPGAPSKTDLREQLAAALASDVAIRERAYRAAREGATHDEAKPENDKDTRALEASYLARGEAARLEELRAALAQVQSMRVQELGPEDPAILGALVTVDDEDGSRAFFWLAPHGGGQKLAEGAVQVVTPSSPMGRALLGKRAGEECELLLAGKRRTWTLVAVT